MVKCIICDSRDGEDKETKEKLVFLTMYRIPNLTAKGTLWHTKQSEAITCACAGEKRTPNLYKSYKDMAVGTVVNVTFGVNDFTNKTIVANVEVFAKPNYDKPLF